jgi:putative aldouronate transport system permease protein
VLPLSLPSIATITLFYAVGYWNSYFNMILYVSKSSMKVLQQVLRDVVSATGLLEAQATVDSADVMQPMASESVKGAAIVIATLPIMCVYPFLQKYFVKGVMIGAIKG